MMEIVDINGFIYLALALMKLRRIKANGIVRNVRLDVLQMGRGRGAMDIGKGRALRAL